MARIENAPGGGTESGAELAAHEADTTDAHDASAVSFVPTGNVAATDVQAAIAEVDSETDTRLDSVESGQSTHAALTESVHGLPNAAARQGVRRNSGDTGWDAVYLTSRTERTGWLPTGAIAESIVNRSGASGALTAVSGTLQIVGGMVIPAGYGVSSVSVLSTAAASVPLNQWFCLLDQSRNVLATTVDDTTTAWAANAVKTLLLATTIGGGTPGGIYTPTSDMPVAIGCLQAAATTATLRASGINQNAAAIPPIIAATSTTGLTTPASLGATAGAYTGISSSFYAYCS